MMVTHIPEPVSTAAPVAQSWWESCQQYIYQVLERFKLNTHDLIQLLAFFVMGFCVGFLFKKYVRYFFILTLLFVLLIMIFNRMGIVLINWGHMQQLTGIDSGMTLKQCFEQIALMVRENLLLTISALIGFMLGFRVA